MRGRPRKEEARQDACRVRLTSDERMVLEEMCMRLGYNESECIRRAILAFNAITKK